VSLLRASSQGESSLLNSSSSELRALTSFRDCEVAMTTLPQRTLGRPSSPSLPFSRPNAREGTDSLQPSRPFISIFLLVLVTPAIVRARVKVGDVKAASVSVDLL
jgi:hypothetical protein